MGAEAAGAGALRTDSLSYGARRSASVHAPGCLCAHRVSARARVSVRAPRCLCTRPGVCTRTRVSVHVYGIHALVSVHGPSRQCARLSVRVRGVAVGTQDSAPILLLSQKCTSVPRADAQRDLGWEPGAVTPRPWVGLGLVQSLSDPRGKSHGLPPGASEHSLSSLPFHFPSEGSGALTQSEGGVQLS